MSDKDKVKEIPAHLKKYVVASDEDFLNMLKIDITSVPEEHFGFIRFQVGSYIDKNIERFSDNIFAEIFNSRNINNKFFSLKKSILNKINNSENLLELSEKFSFSNLSLSKEGKDYKQFMTLVYNLMSSKEHERVKLLFETNDSMKMTLEELVKSGKYDIHNNDFKQNLLNISPEVALLSLGLSTEQYKICFSDNYGKKSFNDYFLSDYNKIISFCNTKEKSEIFLDFFYDDICQNLKNYFNMKDFSFIFEFKLEIPDTEKDKALKNVNENIFKLIRSSVEFNSSFFDVLTKKMMDKGDIDVLNSIFDIKVKHIFNIENFMTGRTESVQYFVNLAQTLAYNNKSFELSTSEFLTNKIFVELDRKEKFFTRKVSFADYCLQNPSAGLIYLRDAYHKNKMTTEDENLYVCNLGCALIDSTSGLDRDLISNYLKNISDLKHQHIVGIVPELIKKLDSKGVEDIKRDLEALVMYVKLHADLNTSEHINKKLKV